MAFVGNPRSNIIMSSLSWSVVLIPEVKSTRRAGVRARG